MPFDDRDDLHDRTCDECGHHGMKSTQVPSPDGPTSAFKCPSCGAIDPGESSPGGMYVNKR